MTVVANPLVLAPLSKWDWGVVNLIRHSLGGYRDIWLVSRVI